MEDGIVKDGKTTINHSTIIEGNIKAQEHLIINGTIKGKVEINNFSLFLGPSGRLEGEAHAQDVRIRGHMKGVARLAFSPDGRTIASAGDDGTAQIWDLDTGQKVREIAASLGKPITSLSDTRNELLEKGIITAPRKGHVASSLPGFLDYVLGVTCGNDVSEHRHQKQCRDAQCRSREPRAVHQHEASVRAPLHERRDLVLHRSEALRGGKDPWLSERLEDVVVSGQRVEVDVQLAFQLGVGNPFVGGGAGVAQHELARHRHPLDGVGNTEGGIGLPVRDIRTKSSVLDHHRHLELAYQAADHVSAAEQRR